MDERLKLVRKHFHLSQESFADRLGIKRSAISNYEIGRNAPIDAVISLICREFNVSEEWLRTGKGEMFAPEPTFDLSEYAARHGMTALETEILKAYLDLDPSVRESLLEHFKSRLARPAPDTTGQDQPKPEASAKDAGADVVARLAELERQNQALSAKVAAMEQEDALLGLIGGGTTSPSVSAGSSDPAEKAKK